MALSILSLDIGGISRFFYKSVFFFINFSVSIVVKTELLVFFLKDTQYLTLNHCLFVLNEPVHEKTNNLHKRKQSRRSASR